uniref:Uncharacterized protein n=1 Tax=Parascaris equorum TaxID=6256 RepID=A0A914RVN9_PAREQ
MHRKIVKRTTRNLNKLITRSSFLCKNYNIFCFFFCCTSVESIAPERC